MSEAIDMYRDMKELHKLKRQRFGVPCPRCKAEQPRRQATILLPGQACRVHRPAYVDPRPRITADEFNAAMAGTGWTQEQSRC